MNGKCDWSRCKAVANVGYLINRELCNRHFQMFCDAQDEGREDWARKNIRLAPRKRPDSSKSGDPPTKNVYLDNSEGTSNNNISK